MDGNMANATTNHIPGIEILEFDELRDWHKFQPLFENYKISFFLPFWSKTPFKSGEDTLDHALNGNIPALINLKNIISWREHCGHDLLTIAAYGGHLDLVKWLHEQGLGLGSAIKSELTPLLAAAIQENTDVVTWLLENGVSGNTHNEDGVAALHIAAYNGNWNLLNCLLVNGADVDSQDKEGRTALMVACQMGHLCIVELLISFNADVKKKAMCGKTALHYAVVTGHFDCVRKLLSGDGYIKESADGWGLLSVAAYHGSVDIVTFLLDSGLDINFQDDLGRTALMAATEASHAEIVNLLLAQGASISLKSSTGVSAFDVAVAGNDHDLAKGMVNSIDMLSKDHMGNTPLLYACRYDQLDLVKLLMHQAAKYSHVNRTILINQQNDLRVSPLLAACMTNNYELAKYVIENGAKNDAKSINGLNAYQMAFISGSEDIVEIMTEHFIPCMQSLHDCMVLVACTLGDIIMLKQLHERGSDITRVSMKGVRPLMMASYHGHMEIVKYLVDNGAVIDGRNKHGFSALAYAIVGDHHKIVDYLLGHGANLNFRNSSGKTLCHILTEERNLDLLKRVAHLGMDIDFKDNVRGVTPLMIASENGWLDVVQMLVELGADVSVKCRNGKSALTYASSVGNNDIISYLSSQPEVNVLQVVFFSPGNSRGTLLTNSIFHGGLPHFNGCLFGNTDRILESHLNVNSVSPLGFTALHYAAYHGQKEMIEWLVSHGAILNSFGKNKLTPLMLACINDQTKIVELLLQHRTLLNSKGVHDINALFCAVSRDSAILDMLLSNGALVDILGTKCQTALMTACVMDDLHAVKSLLKFGANINAKKAEDETSLIIAATFEHVEITKLLLEQGADTTVKTAYGKTAFECAAFAGYSEICDLIKQATANAKSTKDNEDQQSQIPASGSPLSVAVDEGSESNDGEDSSTDAHDTADESDKRISIVASTPLIAAVQDESYTCTKILLEEGADVNYQDDKGRTALMHAVLNGNLAIVKLLVEAGADLDISDNAGKDVITVVSGMCTDEMTMYLHSQKANSWGDGETSGVVNNCVWGKLKELQEALQNPKDISVEVYNICLSYTAATSDLCLLDTLTQAQPLTPDIVLQLLKQCIEQENTQSLQTLLRLYKPHMSDIDTLAQILILDRHAMLCKYFWNCIVSRRVLVALSQLVLRTALDKGQFRVVLTVISLQGSHGLQTDIQTLKHDCHTLKPWEGNDFQLVVPNDCSVDFLSNDITEGRYCSHMMGDIVVL